MWPLVHTCVNILIHSCQSLNSIWFLKKMQQNTEQDSRDAVECLLCRLGGRASVQILALTYQPGLVHPGASSIQVNRHKRMTGACWLLAESFGFRESPATLLWHPRTSLSVRILHSHAYVCNQRSRYIFWP